MLFVVALVVGTLLVLRDALLIFCWFVGVVEFKPSQLVLDALNHNLSNLIQLILANVFLLVLHEES